MKPATISSTRIETEFVFNVTFYIDNLFIYPNIIQKLIFKNTDNHDEASDLHSRHSVTA